MLAATAIQGFVTLTMLALPTVAPSAAADFGVAPQLVGVQVSLLYVAAATASGLAGPVVQRWGAGTVSVAAVTGAVGGLALLIPGSLALALPASLMIGLAYGVTNPAAALILARHCPPERRNLVFSLKQTGVPLGGVVAGLLLPGITGWLGWQAALGVACAGGLALALVLLPSRAVWDEGRSPVRLSPAAVIGSLRAVWAMPALRALAMATFCYAAMQLTLMSFAVTLLVGEVGWSLLAAGAAFSAMQATGAAGRVLWGAVADRLGRSAWVLSGLGFVSAGAAILTAGLGPDSATGWVLAVLLLFAATAIGWNGVFLAEVARIGGPEGAGRTTGAVMVFTFSGVVIGPALYSGVFWLAGSHGAAMGLMAAFPIIGSLLVLRGAGVSSQPRVAL